MITQSELKANSYEIIESLKKRIAELEQQSEARLQEAKIQACELDTQKGIVRNLCNIFGLRVYDFHFEEKVKNALSILKLEQQVKGVDDLMRKETTTGRLHNSQKRSFIFCQDANKYAIQLRKKAKQLGGDL